MIKTTYGKIALFIFVTLMVILIQTSCATPSTREVIKIEKPNIFEPLIFEELEPTNIYKINQGLPIYINRYEIPSDDWYTVREVCYVVEYNHQIDISCAIR